MMPRYYTIASSALLSPTKVRIAISLSEFTSKNGRKFIGLTSEYFKRLFTSHFKEESKCDVSSRIFIKESLFEFPEDPKVPMVMIGPVTGVVPFIAFAEERKCIKEAKPETELGRAILYFGCKEREHDYIYKSEIAEFKAKGYITDLHEAFSREQEEKVYVQHILKSHGKEVLDMIQNQNAHVYVCGATSMGKAVETVLEELIGEKGPQYLHEMKENKRFAKEVWAA